MKKKTILIFSLSKLEEMKEKGNLSYVKYYEAFFDEVYMVYLTGKSSNFRDGNTFYISLGRGKAYSDLILMPFRLYKFAREKNPSVFLTADLIFSWWSSLIVRLFMKAKIFIMPVCMPHIIYNTTKRTLTGVLPRFIEKVFINLSFMSANKIITSKNLIPYIKWLSNNLFSKKKLVILDCLVDEMPPPQLFKKLYHSTNPKKIVKNEPIILLYVGRLHKEKFVYDIIEMFKILVREYRQHNVILWLVGDGEERKVMEKKVFEYALSDKVIFWGYKNAEELYYYYNNAHIFISPLTGTSFREATLSSLPIVCYKIDWISEGFKDNIHLIYVKDRDVREFADKVYKLINDDKLYCLIQKNMSNLAWKKWNITNIKLSLNKLYLLSLSN